MPATSPTARRFRLGRPSLFLPMAALAVAVLVVLGWLVAAGPSEPAKTVGGERLETLDQRPTGAGTKPDGLGGVTEPGLFEDVPDVVPDGGATNAVDAEEGGEMPTGGTPATGGPPGETPAEVTPGELAEQPVPDHADDGPAAARGENGSAGAGTGGD